MFTMLLAHMVAALVAPLLVRWIGRSAFYPLAVVPAASAVWLATFDPRTLGDAPVEVSVPWIPAFGIDLALRLDTLSWVLGLIATGIGAMVLLYCARYFKDSEPGLGRFAGVLTAFAGAMVGLVLADDVMVIYTFWELTTVFSYLLVGHYQDKQASRRAALNALISTTAGGLAMLVGMLMVAAEAGTLRLSEIVADPMWTDAGPYLITAMVLMLAGATSKSALVPTHFWLPGAMAAPTPVSAYLHAAAMVKAGIYLILRMAPALTHLEVITLVLSVLGAATMLLGGWRALRQTDIKLLLAYGTVSQLGFLAAVTGLATHDAVLAGLAMLIAHALFKAPLFMVVGIIDKRFGTRDLRILSGVGRVAPVLAMIGTLSAASMAAVPPLYGFVAKESIYSALWYAGGWQRLLLIALVAGSVLTVAYSWRFVRGAFGPAPGAPRVAAVRISPLYWLAPALITAASLALIVLTIAVNLVANFVAPNYMLCDLFPRWLTFRRAGLVTAIIGLVILPWTLYNSPLVINYFLGGLGAILGPFFGLIMVDYWIIRRQRLNIPDLYSEAADGTYHYRNGFNPRAFYALIPAALISLAIALVPVFHSVSDFSWIIGAIIAALLHLALVPKDRTYQHVDGEAIARPSQ